MSQMLTSHRSTAPVLAEGAGFTIATAYDRLRGLAASQAPPATVLIRAAVGAVFLLEGALKFVNPEELGVGRFLKIGIPFPSFFAPFDGVFEIACGILLAAGLVTRLAAIPMIINMIVAIVSTKIPMLLSQGFWKATHEARLDVTMLLACVFLLRMGAGPLSLDARVARSSAGAPSGRRILGLLAVATCLSLVTGRAAALAADATDGEQRVSVRLTEYAIEMPAQLRAGRTLFTVTNAGTMRHRFEIEGKGIEREIESGLDEGATGTLEIELKPGSYDVYCPMPGHRKAGMSLRVKVG